MKVKNLKLDQFMKAVTDVRDVLADKHRCVEFLDRATREAPIIAELLQQFANLGALPGFRRRKASLDVAFRDLLILLAFHSLDKGKRGDKGFPKI